jgi:hypothetical protein
MIGSYHSSITLGATAAPSALAFPSWLSTRWRSITTSSAGSSERSEPPEEENPGPIP